MTSSRPYARSFVRFLGCLARKGWNHPIRRHQPRLVRPQLIDLEARLVPAIITRTSSSVFFNDLKNDLTSAYASYQITNDDGRDYDNVWATVGDFRTDVGPVIVQAGSHSSTRIPVGSLSRGQTKSAFFYLESSQSGIQASQFHTVTFFHGSPEEGQIIGRQEFAFAKTDSEDAVEDTIQANSNKVSSIEISHDELSLGANFTVTVTGSTGTIGDGKVMAFTPAATKDWRADAFQLVGSSIVLSGENRGTYTDTLLIPADKLISKKDTDYVATYSFRVVEEASADLIPAAYISSGSNVKHTKLDDLDDEALEIESEADETEVTIRQTVTPGSLAGAGEVTYEVTFANQGDTDVTLDQIINVLASSPANAGFVSGSATFDGSPLANPSVSGQTLRWGGLFTIPSGREKKLTFKASIPGTAGTYENLAYAKIGDYQIDSTRTLEDNKPSRSTVTVTATAPPAPGTPDLIAASDTGSSSTDNLTNLTILTFTGTGPANSTIHLYSGSTLIGTGTADGSGNWSIQSTTLASGVHSIGATATVGGVTSRLSATLSVTIDTMAPSSPSIPDLTAGTDSGSSNSDNLTNVTTPVFTGTAEAGSMVQLFAGTTLMGSGLADGSGNYAITSSVLSPGSYTITAKATDAAGNVSTASGGLALVIDTTAPSSPSIPDLTAGTDSGSSNSDNLTSVTTPVFTGTAEAGSTVQLFAGSTLIGSGVADGSGNYAITSSVLSPGSYTITAKATDASGNVSTASGGLVLVIDTTAPSSPSIPDLTAGTDSGSSNSDNLTSVTTPVFTGTAEAGSTVQLFAGSTLIGSGVADGSGNYAITSSVLSPGSYTITAKATDAAGNVSTASGGLAIVIDTVAPSAPLIAQITDDAPAVTGLVNSGGFTNDTTPLVRISLASTGASEGDQLILLRNGNPVGAPRLITAADLVAGFVDWSTGPLGEGLSEFSATLTDQAGNASLPSAKYAITIDTTNPAAPTISQVSDNVAPITGTVFSGGKTDDPTPTIRVTLPTSGSRAQEGDLVQLVANGSPLGSPVTLTAAAIAAGFVDITTGSLTDGTYEVSATLIDRAGNTGPGSSTFRFQVDTILPGAFLQGIVFVDANANGQQDVGEAPLSGAVVQVFSADGATLLGQVTTGASGTYLFNDHSNLNPGVKLQPGTTYKIVQAVPAGYQAGAAFFREGVYTVQASDRVSYTVKTLDPQLSGPNPLSLTFTSMPAGALTAQIQLNGQTKNQYLTQLNIRATGGDLPAARNFVSFCVDQPHSVGVGNVFPVLPVGATSSLDGLQGQAGRIAYIYNHYGQALLDPVQGAAIQLAILELTYDSVDDLSAGNLRYLGPSGSTSTADGNALLAAARFYLADSVGKTEPALYLDATLGGQSVPLSGRQGQMVAQHFSFANYQIPVFTNTNTAQFTYGQGVDFQFTATANPTFGSSNLPAGLILDPSGRLRGSIAAGTYTFTVMASNGAQATQEFTLVVDKAGLTLSGLVANNKVYDGTTLATLDISGVSLGTIFGTDQVTLDFSHSTALFADKNAATSLLVSIDGIRLAGAQANNYRLNQPIQVRADITPRPITISARSVEGVYGSVSPDGQTGFSVSGLADGDRIDWVTLTTDALLSTSGHYRYRETPWVITASAPRGDRYLSSNYSPSFAPGELTIRQRELVVGATGQTREYNGTSDARVDLSDNRIHGDLLDLLYSTARYTDGPDAGIGKPIQVDGVSFSGTDAGNYFLPDDTVFGQGTVTPKVIKATLPDASQIYCEPVELNPVVPSPVNQAGSAFLTSPVKINQFTNRFTFRTNRYTRTPGDGITFTIQGIGSGALGASGEGLGYQGIGKSVAIKFDLIDNYGEGTSSTGLYRNGVNPSLPETPSQPLWVKGIDLQTDHIIAVEMTYDGSRLLVTVVDTKARLSSVQAYSIDLSSELGSDQAFIGFTGGTGTLTSRQSILSWNFRNADGALVEMGSGIPSNASNIDVNGVAVLRDGAIMLTGANKAFDLPTGIPGESVVVFLKSEGNFEDSPVGTYPITAALYDATGKASNYTFDFVPGTLTVGKKAVTYTIPNQTQTYGQPINLNEGFATRPTNQAGSAFLDQRIDLSQGFQTEFTFLTTQSVNGPCRGGTTIADGLTFTIQRRGTGALGKSGHGLGYQGIGKSVAIKFDNFNNLGEGRSSTGLFVGGANPANDDESIDLLSQGIDLTRPDPVTVTIQYNALLKQLDVRISQPQTTPTGVVTHSASQRYSIDLGARLLGNTAYFGFTGATGALTSRQEIQKWTIGTGGQSSNVLDLSGGFTPRDHVLVNGSAVKEGSSLVLTCFPDSTRIPVCCDDEYLTLVQSSLGNTATARVGTYPIEGTVRDGTGLVSNFEVTLVPGTLTVARANLEIKAKNLEGVYGQVALNRETGFEAVGLAPGETIGSVVLTTDATRSPGGLLEAGGWTILPSAASGGTFDPSNYAITYARGFATIRQAPLVIQARDLAKTYGNKLEIRGTEFTTEGLCPGDSVDWVSICATGDIAGAPAGVYSVVPSKPEGKGLKNYQVVFRNGTLTVAKREVTIRIDDREQAKGTVINLNRLTPQLYHQAGSAFFDDKVDITNFRTTFRFQTSQVDRDLADGFTFVIQNQGLNALGQKGGGLGYQGIGQSIAIKFDLFSNDGEGNNSTGLFQNGESPTGRNRSIDLTGTNINLQNRGVFDVDILYRSQRLTVTITDRASGRSETQSYSVNLPGVVGANRAYVGFTGGTGGLVARQSIQAWDFQNGSVTAFRFADGFAGANRIRVNGSSRINGNDLTLTAAAFGVVANTGVNDERLFVWLSSEGNTALAELGTYLINGQVQDGTGLVSNYLVNLVPGKLRVV